MPIEHRVALVEDHELPEPHDWALARTEGLVVLIMKRSRVTPATLTEALGALASMPARPTVVSSGLMARLAS